MISMRTGGLQDQNYDPETGKEYGVSIFPNTTSYTGSQQIYYIRECRATDEDVLSAYIKMYNMPRAERRSLGEECANHARTLFGMEKMIQSWDNAIVRKVNEFKNGYPDRVRFKKI